MRGGRKFLRSENTRRIVVCVCSTVFVDAAEAMEEERLWALDSSI